jgi:hypothetical protein
VVKLIERKQGASITELMKARGWQAHSVRAAISTLRKQSGLQIESLRDPRRGRVYRLVRPGEARATRPPTEAASGDKMGALEGGFSPLPIHGRPGRPPPVVPIVPRSSLSVSFGCSEGL